MAELFKADLPQPSPSTYGGGIIDAPRQDQSQQLLVGGIGQLAIDAYKGKKLADMQFDMDSLEEQTKQANDVLLQGGEKNIALSKFTDKMKTLDAGVFSGSLTPQEYKIKRELLLKEHEKQTPGLAADFQKIYASSDTEEVKSQFELLKTQREFQDKQNERIQTMVLQQLKEAGVDMHKYAYGTPDERALQQAYGTEMIRMQQSVKQAEAFVAATKNINVGLGLKKMMQWANDTLPVMQLEASKNILSLAQTVNPQMQVDETLPTEVASVRAFADTASKMNPTQKVDMRRQIEAMKNTALNKVSSGFIGLEIGSENTKLMQDTITRRYDMYLNLLDNTDLAKVAEAEVKIRQSSILLGLSQTRPDLFKSLTLINEFRNVVPPIFVQDAVGKGLRDELLGNQRKAGLGYAGGVADGKSPYTEVRNDVDSKGTAKIASQNLNFLLSAVAAGPMNPQQEAAFKAAIDSYMVMPNNPNHMSMEDINSYMRLMANPKMQQLVKDNTQFGDKFLGNITWIWNNKIEPFVDSQVRPLITADTRVDPRSNMIIFTGRNADKLNKFAAILNNAASSMDAYTKPMPGEQELPKGFALAQLKSHVQQIVNSQQKGQPIIEKSSWIDSFLNSKPGKVDLGEAIIGTAKGAKRAAEVVSEGVAATPGTIDDIWNWWTNAQKEQRDSFLKRIKKEGK